MARLSEIGTYASGHPSDGNAGRLSPIGTGDGGEWRVVPAPRTRLGRPTSRYGFGMVRTLDLVGWAGRWVALDEHDRVMRDAETLNDLMAVLEAEGIEGVSIMRAPVPGEPVMYGLG